MNCERMETRMVAFLDGRLGTAERREVEAHLAECAACRTRAEEFRALWGVLDAAPALEPSAAFDARLRQNIAAEPRAWWLGWLVPSPRMAVAAALLVILSISILSLAPPPETETAQVVQNPSEEEFKIINNLQLLEDYDVLANFEVLSELSKAPAQNQREM